MQTFEEYKTAVAAHQHRVAVWAGLSVAAMFAWMVPLAVFRDELHPVLVRLFGEVGAGIALGVLMVISLLIFLGGMWFGSRRGQRDPRLRCPYCGKMLVAHAIVVATRNCAECGRRVLDDPA